MQSGGGWRGGREVIGVVAGRDLSTLGRVVVEKCLAEWLAWWSRPLDLATCSRNLGLVEKFWSFLRRSLDQAGRVV